MSSGGALAVLLVLAWRLPCIVKVMLQFGLDVQRLNADLLRACCMKKKPSSADAELGQDKPNVLP